MNVSGREESELPVEVGAEEATGVEAALFLTATEEVAAGAEVAEGEAAELLEPEPLEPEPAPLKRAGPGTL